MTKLTKIFLVFICLSVLILPTINVKAETLKDYQNLLKKYQDEQKANQAEINKTEN